MSTTLPTMTRTVDDKFTDTWYTIRAEAIDNILDANVVTAALKEKGVFKIQVGGDRITRTIQHGTYDDLVEGLSEGKVLSTERNDLETMAWWDWKYFTVPVKRTLISDQQNNGPEKIKDYVDKRLSAARNALNRKIETMIMRATAHPDIDSSQTTDADEPFSLIDYIPNNASTQYLESGYSYGNIRRDNPWWQPEDFTYDNTAAGNYNDTKSGPYALTLYDDMKNVYNTITNHLESPDLIITSQLLFEAYDSFAVAKEQIIRQESTNLANLGYEVLQFRGKPLVWTDLMTENSSKSMIMLNSEFFDIIYDPNLWFDMSEWRQPVKQMERVAFITCSMQPVGYQPRRNARIHWNA